ncbi:MAG: GIY-YIG nuclease family protein [bacterium]|nr:GIY-YIG nuclease family protein [bacterium]
MTLNKLKEQLKKLPANPGIYIFKTLKNKPLYIGKALNLKNRIKHYLKTDDARLRKMISEARKIEFVETDSDIEALILESQYIKKHKPDFNIMLRDDKQYSFVVFTNDQFPKIFLTHQPKKVASSKVRVVRGSREKNLNTYYQLLTTDFIGPFTDGSALKTTLRLLRKIFPYCTCRQPHNNYCLNYHIGKCLGVCCLKQQVASSKQKVVRDYKRNIKAIKDILSGKKTSLIKDFENEMKRLGKQEKFEEAMELQNKIKKLKRVFENARIVATSNKIRGTSKVLEELKKILKLPTAPHRIEGYDVANIQGKYAVGAMIVFTDGIPDKNKYRKFKIYTKSSPDDTVMLHEILTRRFNHSEWPYPDLIVVDGGKAQFNAVKVVSKNIPVIALTKNEKHVGYKLLTDNQEISLSKLPTNIKNLLLQIDSEAHRFAISYYRKLHQKRALQP